MYPRIQEYFVCPVCSALTVYLLLCACATINLVYVGKCWLRFAKNNKEVMMLVCSEERDLNAHDSVMGWRQSFLLICGLTSFTRITAALRIHPNERAIHSLYDEMICLFSGCLGLFDRMFESDILLASVSWQVGNQRERWIFCSQIFVSCLIIES